MTVKRVAGAKSKKTKAHRRQQGGRTRTRKSGRRLTIKAPTLDLALPTTPKDIDTNFLHYLLLVYGREKIGKTVLMSSFPNTIFATTEPGTKGMRIHEFNHENGGCTDWPIFCAMVELLTTTQNPFHHVTIDTVDRLYDMCLDYVCDTLGIPYPGQDPAGEEDYGLSWRAVKQEFLAQLHKLVQAGYGVAFTSHSKELSIKPRGGEKYTRIVPTMSNQARGIVEAIVDYFFYAEYVKEGAGTARILICEGDETVWAGARPGAEVTFPRYLPLLAKDGYQVIEAAFRGEDVGLQPEGLRAAKITTKTAKQLLDSARLAGRRVGLPSGKKAVVKKGGVRRRVVRRRA